MIHNNLKGEIKNLGPMQNVSIQVIDSVTDRIVHQHVGHNAATNALLVGLAHYLQGDGVLNQGVHQLSAFVPRFMSLGTMGLVNQLEDEDGLPMGLGYKSYRDYDPDKKCWVYNRCNQLTGEQRDFLGVFNSDQPLTEEQEEALRFKDYMDMMPGYGADGYDLNMNNSRTSSADGYIMAGLGPPFSRRSEVGAPALGMLPVTNVKPCPVCGDVNCPHSQHGEITFDPYDYDTVRCELISDTFPRQHISYRDIVPEEQAELPKTIDVVFSSMVSTGALRQFRRTDHDYVFITEAGLWSRRDWNLSGSNGLLAGYRIAPPNSDNWVMYPDHSIFIDRYYNENNITGIPTSDDRFNAVMHARMMISEIDFERARENRLILKKNIIKVGINQIVQIIWKVQLGEIEQLFPGAYCPNCRTEYIPELPGTSPREPSNVCSFCCRLDAGNIDLIDEEFCPRICDIDAGDLEMDIAGTILSGQHSGAGVNSTIYMEYSE